MTRKPDEWMPLHIGAYHADTTHLTRDQHGAYFLLLMAYWRRGGPLPAEDGRLAAIVKATAAEWRKLRPVMVEFFAEEDGLWHQKRADEELTKAKRMTEAKAEAGRKGAAKKWHNDGGSDGKVYGTAMAQPSSSHRQTDAPLPTTLTNTESPIAKAIGRSAENGLQDAGKPEWWPIRDRYGRVTSEITEKILFDVGKAVLGKSAGGQVTKLRKLYRGDMRAVTDFLLQAEEKSEPGEWFAGVIKRAEIDEHLDPKHVIYPEKEYRV